MPQMTIHVSRKAIPGVDVVYEVQDYVDLSHMYDRYWDVVGGDPPLLTMSFILNRVEMVQLADTGNDLIDDESNFSIARNPLRNRWCRVGKWMNTSPSCPLPPSPLPPHD